MGTVDVKVGDRVRLTGDSWEGIGTPREVFTIEGVDPHDGPWFHDPAGYRWFVTDGGWDVTVVSYADTAGEDYGVPTAPLSEDLEVHMAETIDYRPDNAVDPDHYKFPGGAEVIDIVKHLGFLEGNAIKYLARAGRKGDKLEDLLKARQYVEWAIEKERN